MTRSPYYTHTRTERRVRLEVQTYVAQQLLSKFEKDSMDGVEWRRYQADDAWVRRAVADIMGRKRTETVRYPADWWQHVKQRFAPAWFLKRWPVLFTTVEVDAFALFPELAPVRAHYLELAFCEPARVSRRVHP